MPLYRSVPQFLQSLGEAIRLAFLGEAIREASAPVSSVVNDMDRMITGIRFQETQHAVTMSVWKAHYVGDSLDPMFFQDGIARYRADLRKIGVPVDKLLGKDIQGVIERADYPTAWDRILADDAD